MTRERPVRFCEGGGVRFPSATRRLTAIAGDASDGPGWRRARGRITCSPNYVAPERLCGYPADFRSDLYSLGVVLYEMATGWPPFSADSLEDVLSNVLAGHHPCSVLSVAPDRPASLDRLVKTLLECKARDRYQSATEVSRALRAVRNRCHEPAEMLRTIRCPSDVRS